MRGYGERARSHKVGAVLGQILPAQQAVDVEDEAFQRRAFRRVLADRDEDSADRALAVRPMLRSVGLSVETKRQSRGHLVEFFFDARGDFANVLADGIGPALPDRAAILPDLVEEDCASAVKETVSGRG